MLKKKNHKKSHKKVVVKKSPSPVSTSSPSPDMANGVGSGPGGINTASGSVYIIVSVRSMSFVPFGARR